MKRILVFSDQQGQALVELAISLSLLMLIILGIVEFGRIGQAYLAAAHASREGARIGALRYSDDEIYKAVDDALLSLGTMSILVSVTPNEALRQRRDPLEVVVTVQVPLITPMGRLLPDPFPVYGRTVMRVE